MGVDGAKAESVVNLTGNRLGVLWTANAFLAAGAYILWKVTSGTVSFHVATCSQLKWRGGRLTWANICRVMYE